MTREVIGGEITVHIADKPAEGECCDKCGADASHYRKRDDGLKGGFCDACGGIWLPDVSFGPEQPIYADEIEVERTPDGGATIHLNRKDGDL